MKIRIDPDEHLHGDSSDLESVLDNLCALGFLRSVQKPAGGGYLVEVDEVVMRGVRKLMSPRTTPQIPRGRCSTAAHVTTRRAHELICTEEKRKRFE